SSTTYSGAFTEYDEVGQVWRVDGTAKVSSDDVTRIVPALDAKLGLDYSHVFDNESVLTIEGGYQWTQYIDAIDRLDGGAELSGFGQAQQQENFPASVSVNRTTSSVGFHGPY